MKPKILLLMLPMAFLFSCVVTDDEPEPDPVTETLVGQDGNPRFNLQFNNEENVDLDLYVKTPNGDVIYYSNTEADGGVLDVDCLCYDCPQGPNENIYWENGTAPSGTFQYWVEYYGSCGFSSATSDFTVRVIRNGQVLETKTGSLSSGSSSVWSFQQ